jgi:lipopolysaccharide export system protein LptA
MKAILSAVTAAALAAAVAPAMAQSEWTFNPNAALDVTSEEQRLNAQTCTVALSGNVEIMQDRIRLRARMMNGYSERRGGDCGDSMTRVEADGDVYYVTPNESVRADHAVYNLANNTATFTGGVIVVRGQNVAAADKLVINLATNDFTLSGHTRSILYPERSGQ